MAMIEPPPSRDALVDRKGDVTRRWENWLNKIRGALNLAPQREIPAVALDTQSAAIVATDLPTPPLAAGLYRVTTFLRVTTAAGVSSSVAVTLTFTCGLVACSFALPALTANVTNAPQSETRMLLVDDGSVVQYAVAYASNPAAAMVYELSIALERVEA